MKDKVFIDTNILVYSQRSDDLEKRNISQELIQNSNFVISTQSFNEMCNVLSKKYKISANKIVEIIFVLSELAQEIFIVNKDTILNALKIHNDYKYSYYDSLIIASALECDCRCLFSEDMSDGQIIDGKLKIVNPFIRPQS